MAINGKKVPYIWGTAPTQKAQTKTQTDKQTNKSNNILKKMKKTKNAEKQ